MSTEIHNPPMEPSEEATEEQLQRARHQGETYALALQAMNKEAGVDVQRAGEYEVAIAVESAEGMYHLKGEGNLVWHEPEKENAHIEVAVRDAADGRFVPGLTVHVTVIDGDGNELGTHEQPMLWHPWLYHYGRNWELPGDGNYKLRVRIEAPTFMRHDHENGKRYAKPVEAEFNRYIKTGQKRAT